MKDKIRIRREAITKFETRFGLNETIVDFAGWRIDLPSLTDKKRVELSLFLGAIYQQGKADAMDDLRNLIGCDT